MAQHLSTPGTKSVGNLFTPKDLDRNAKHPAIIIGHPMGAVKQQGSNLYARQQSKLVIVPGAGNVGLYDRVNLIHWDKLNSFFHKNMAFARIS